MNIITTHQCILLDKEAQGNQKGLFYETTFVHDTDCIVSSIILLTIIIMMMIMINVSKTQIKHTTYLVPVSRPPPPNPPSPGAIPDSGDRTHDTLNEIV